MLRQAAVAAGAMAVAALARAGNLLEPGYALDGPYRRPYRPQSTPESRRTLEIAQKAEAEGRRLKGQRRMAAWVKSLANYHPAEGSSRAWADRALERFGADHPGGPV